MKRLKQSIGFPITSAFSGDLMSKPKSLLDAVSQVLDDWLANPPILARNGWVYGKEGSIYIRYNTHTDQIDLSSFSIHRRYQKKGIAKAIIAMACQKAVGSVKIENILVPEWAEKVCKYQFSGRNTRVTSDGFSTTVFFQREDHE